MTETFDLPLKVGASGSEKLGVNKVQFGDGYESRTSNGLNNQTSEWNVSITGNNERLAPYFDFMARHGGVRSFYWTPPSGEKGLFKAEEWKTDTLGNGLFTLTTTFTRTYSAGPIETRTINIVDGGGALIDDTKPSIATAYSSQKTEEVIKQSVDSLKEEDNPLTQYAKKTALAETDKKVASLEKVKPVLTINNDKPDEKGNITITVESDATGQINVAIDALKKEENPFDQYALQESLNKVEKTANAAATKTELGKTNDKVTSLEKIKPVLTINNDKPDEKGNVTIPAGVSIKDTVKANDSTWSSEQIDEAIQADDKTSLFSVEWWPDRNNIPIGRVPADGTLLSREVYVAVAAALDKGVMPQVSNDVWLNDPSKRGCYVANDGNDNFRIPDYNGIQLNSIGGLFVRGGKNTDVVDGTIQKDAIRNIVGMVSGLQYPNPAMPATGAFKTIEKTCQKAPSADNWGQSADFDASRVVPTAAENRPVNVTGCWIIKLFGTVTNTSALDASTLALSLAALSTRVSLIEDTLTLEKSNARFIYPNEGTEDNPKEIVNNTRYVLDNPFPEAKYVECVALVLFDGKWGIAPYIYSSGSFGVSAAHFGNKIILQTGTNVLLTAGQAQGNPFGNISNQSKLPCKIFIKKVM